MKKSLDTNWLGSHFFNGPQRGSISYWDLQGIHSSDRGGFNQVLRVTDRVENQDNFQRGFRSCKLER